MIAFESENCSEMTNSSDRDLEEMSTDDLPNSLIVTNLDNCIFFDPVIKDKFEELFKQFEDDVTFQYFKSFKRARINYISPISAAKARITCHQRKFGDSLINCYFAQPTTLAEEAFASNKTHLVPPLPQRQFLISPPASPPLGWQPREEGEPVINYDLLTALTNLAPGESHELHPPSEAQPAIVVHICEDQDRSFQGPKSKIQQTQRPPLRSSSEGSEDSNDSLPFSP